MGSNSLRACKQQQQQQQQQQKLKWFVQMITWCIALLGFDGL
jgi:hypothetical protein